jgi:hypothetical protein
MVDLSLMPFGLQVKAACGQPKKAAFPEDACFQVSSCPSTDFVVQGFSPAKHPQG